MKLEITEDEVGNIVSYHGDFPTSKDELSKYSQQQIEDFKIKLEKVIQSEERKNDEISKQWLKSLKETKNLINGGTTLC